MTIILPTKEIETYPFCKGRLGELSKKYLEYWKTTFANVALSWVSFNLMSPYQFRRTNWQRNTIFNISPSNRCLLNSMSFEQQFRWTVCLLSSMFLGPYICWTDCLLNRIFAISNSRKTEHTGALLKLM